ncbi:alpha/beta-hydrolase [Phlegmacium glaucopus]|nr:alpha/beta-hydrolase [Phlegmacium glaucopus]
MLFSLPATLNGLISTLLWASAPTAQNIHPAITFQLRHRHAVTNTSRIIFSDISPESSSFGDNVETQFSIQTKVNRVPRPESFAAFKEARRNSQRAWTPALDWHNWDVASPDVSKRTNLLQLAKMSLDAYEADNTTGWYDVSDSWGSTPFGWLPEEDGLRGHIFVSTDNSTVIIAIKGTSAPWLAGGGGPTVVRDQKNDNLLFSCCCARVGPTWSTVCDCYDSGYRCDSQCVQDALVDEGLFYPIGLNLYNNITYMYPHANIWLTGHSLGGGLAALLGATFGAPVVAFEAPAERMASRRLHLPSPPSTHHITHVYHTADPIPMGTCTGMTSLCSIGGFALESRCHLGQVVLYDTVQKLGWSVNVRNHGIKVIVDQLLADDSEWSTKDEGTQGDLSMFNWGWGRKKLPRNATDEVPLAKSAVEVEGAEGECVDCFNWEYGNFKNRTTNTGWH